MVAYNALHKKKKQVFSIQLISLISFIPFTHTHTHTIVWSPSTYLTIYHHYHHNHHHHQIHRPNTFPDHFFFLFNDQKFGLIFVAATFFFFLNINNSTVCGGGNWWISKKTNSFFLIILVFFGLFSIIQITRSTIMFLSLLLPCGHNHHDQRSTTKNYNNIEQQQHWI